MITSPGCNIGTSVAIVSSTGSPAGTMIQTMRGADSAFTHRREIRSGRRAELLVFAHRLRAAVVDDERVAVAHQPFDHVAAHAAETHHRELHVCRTIERRVRRTGSIYRSNPRACKSARSCAAD